MENVAKKKHAVAPEITKKTWQNLRKALDELKFSLQPKGEGMNDADDSVQPPAKKQKRDADDAADAKSSSNGKKKQKEFLRTTSRIPTWSPTVVLPRPDHA